MKKIFCIYIILLLALCHCSRKEPVPPGQQTSEKAVVQEKEEEPRLIKKEETSSDADEFFKGGIITREGQSTGVYIVEKGDNIWIISKKYVESIKGSSYTKKDIGNASYWINRINYSNLFGGVNDNLRVGGKVFIPIDQIKKSLKD
ncbi:MAG: hypothetical protein JW827_05955 [Spirochaetes bacterium]|nr:hypothetical protein [Spirochaetota bacterium]